MSATSLCLPSPMSSPETQALHFTQASQASVSARIRRLRKARGWTLADVEKRSRGDLKAVVLGSYERCDRSMSIERAIEIANLFGVPLSELLTEPAINAGDLIESDQLPKKIVIDLRRVKKADYTEKDCSEQLALFLAWIIGLRQDWNGEILSLRRADLDVLSLLMFKSPTSVVQWMKKYHLLIPHPEEKAPQI